MDFSGNPQLKLAYDFVQYSGCNVFLTGRAGTGKTTFLRNLKSESAKRMVVLAPTGVAAINAGGVTIHSFFQLPFGPQIPSDAQEHFMPAGDEARPSASRLTRFSREKINIIKSLDLLVIDEISMVRADLLDAIDATLRRYRDRYKPFGGIQLLMIGDLQQLAPVVKEDEWDILKNYYDSVFFFSSLALQKTEHISIELKNIYRQQDEVFIRLLNRVRDNYLDEKTLKELNRRYIPGFSPNDQKGYITLTTHNFQAREKNVSRLNALKGKVRIFKAGVNG
ncbi:MAG: helicase, partial [Desulfobacteraceae bacterium]